MQTAKRKRTAERFITSVFFDVVAHSNGEFHEHFGAMHLCIFANDRFFDDIFCVWLLLTCKKTHLRWTEKKNLIVLVMI